MSSCCIKLWFPRCHFHLILKEPTNHTSSPIRRELDEHYMSLGITIYHLKRSDCCITIRMALSHNFFMDRLLGSGAASYCPHQSLIFKKIYIYFFKLYVLLCVQCSCSQHSPGVVYYHLFLRKETRIPRVAPFSF